MSCFFKAIWKSFVFRVFIKAQFDFSMGHWEFAMCKQKWSEYFSWFSAITKGADSFLGSSVLDFKKYSTKQLYRFFVQRYLWHYCSNWKCSAEKNIKRKTANLNQDLESFESKKHFSDLFMLFLCRKIFIKENLSLIERIYEPRDCFFN